MGWGVFLTIVQINGRSVSSQINGSVKMVEKITSCFCDENLFQSEASMSYI